MINVWCGTVGWVGEGCANHVIIVYFLLWFAQLIRRHLTYGQCVYFDQGLEFEFLISEPH